MNYKLFINRYLKKYFEYTSDELKNFAKKVSSCANVAELQQTIESFENTLNPCVYAKCLTATKEYINSLNCDLDGRYIKTYYFFGEISYTKKTQQFIKLNKQLDFLIAKYQPHQEQANYSKVFDTLSYLFSSVCDFIVNHPLQIISMILLAQRELAFSMPTTIDSNKSLITDPYLHPACLDKEIRVVQLTGTSYEMGQQYGQQMQDKMANTLQILKAYYKKQGVLYGKVIAKANEFWSRYSNHFAEELFRGVVFGSRMSMDDCKVLLAMETLGSLTESKGDMDFSCSFVGIPASKTQENSTLIGRNYDYGQPFDKIAQDLTVTVMRGSGDNLPTALISMPGQLYCPSCINSQGLFMELNNGGPSGGFVHNEAAYTMLSKMTDTIKLSSNIGQVGFQLLGSNSDYSLIVNVASATDMMSYEFSSNGTCKQYSTRPNEPLVSTNFFQNKTWNVPKPTDDTTWMGVTRRDNLHNLVNAINQHNISTVKQMMDKKIDEGGAKWGLTIYQIIFDPKNLMLYLKPNTGCNWRAINASQYFYDREQTEGKDCQTSIFISSVISVISTFLFSIALEAVRHCRSAKENSTATEESKCSPQEEQSVHIHLIN